MFQLLRSESFIQSLLLLGATAVLTGVLVPLIKGYMDDRKFRQQKLFEADLARQSKVIEAQVQLLESLAQMLWDFQLLAIAVTYYKTLPDEKRYQLAFDDYDKQSWVFFSKIRTEISKARRLTSERTYEGLLKYYEDWLMRNDSALMSLVKRRASHEDWLSLHNLVYHGAENTDKIMTQLAEEFRLVGHGRSAERKR
jgi:glutamate mutase epsilon subunit